MPKIQEVADPQNLMIQFIGAPKSGKSIAAASFPEPVYVFDLESRIEAIARFFPKRDITFDTFHRGDFVKLQEKVNALEKSCPFRSVIFDGITPFADMLLHYGIQMRGHKSAKGKNVGEMDMNTIEDYGVETQGILGLISTLRNIKAHRIVISHLLRVEYTSLDGTTRSSVTTLTGGKKISPKIPGYFNEVWNFKVVAGMLSHEKPKFLVKTINDGETMGATTLPLPAEMDFSKSDSNPEGSLFKVVQDNLKKAGINV